MLCLDTHNCTSPEEEVSFTRTGRQGLLSLETTLERLRERLRPVITVRSAQSALSVLGIFLTATAAGTVGATLIAPLGLAVPERAAWPLAIGFGTLLATLAAGWTANILGPARAHSRLPAIAGLSDGIAVTIAIVGFVIPWLAGFADLFVAISAVIEAFEVGTSRFLVILVLMAAIGIGVSYATVRLRSPAQSLRRDLALSLGLLALEVLVVIAGVTLTCSATSCMA